MSSHGEPAKGKPTWWTEFLASARRPKNHKNDGGFSDTEQELQSVLSKNTLERRVTSPDEIAAIVVSMLSARAAHITGQHVFVDGGYVHLGRALT